MTIPELPASIESEKAVLGAILLNRDAITAVADTLKPDHFYMERHAQIYAAMLHLYGQRIPPDTRTVAEELRRREQLETVGGIAYLSDLTDSTPTAYHITFYAPDVLKTAMRRRLLGAIGQLGALAYDETQDISAVLERAHELIDGAAVALHDPRYTPTRADLLDQEDLPPPTWAIPGLLPQGLTLLIGKPKMRKSWLALAIGIAVASGGRALGSIPVEAGDVLYLALEDSKRRLQARQRKILQGAGAPERLYYMTVAPRVDEGLIGTIETWLRKRKAPRLVIVDVLAMVRPKTSGRGNMYDEDYSAVKPLQELAQRRNVAILVVHHMNKGTESSDVYDMINGSSGVGGSADGLLALQYERGQTNATLHISSRELEDESALALNWDNPTAQWILLGKADDIKASNERQEIIKLFREEKRPLTAKEAADILGKFGAEYQNLRQLIYRMAKEGDLQSVDRGKYALPSFTLLADDDDCDRVTTDHNADHNGFDGIGTPETGDCNNCDPNPTTQNLDYSDHNITMAPFDASESDSHVIGAGSQRLQSPLFGDSLAAASGPLPEIDWDFVRRLHAAGNLAAIRAHCAMRRQDYQHVLRTLGDIP